MKQSSVITLVLAGILILFLLSAIFNSSYTIESGTVGVKRVFGKINPDEQKEGFHLKMPFITDIETVSTRAFPIKAQGGAASKDLQTVATNVELNASVTPEMAAELSKEFVVTPVALQSSIFQPAIQESIKAVTAQYTAAELVTKRAEVRDSIAEAINNWVANLLESKGVSGALTINSVALTEFTFSKEFNAAIEAKVKAEQEAQRAINEKQRAITEAESKARQAELAADAKAYEKTADAEARATATRAQAEAEAFALEKTSEARAAAIDREGQMLEKYPQVLQQQQIDAWNGAFPNFFAPGSDEGVQMLFEAPVDAP